MQLKEIIIQRKIKNGDIAAFEMLFKTYFSPLCSYAHKILNDKDNAEEIVQDFFFNYWKNKETLNIRISLKSYLYMAVRNNCLKYIRQHTVRQKYAEQLIIQDKQNPGPIQSIPIEARELQTLIDQILDQLPQRCGQIFRMSRYEGMKYHQIAQALSISVKTVEANMGKALMILREKLKKYNDYAL